MASKYDKYREDWKRLYVKEKRYQREIAEEYGCHPSTVGRHLREMGVKPDKSKITKSQVEQWKERYVEKGHTTTDIAADYNYSRETIRRHLRESGVVMKSSTATSVQERFWLYTEKTTASECWEWIGGKTGHGYGALWDGEKQIKPHTYARLLMLGLGEIPTEKQGNHHCDNKGCVNPLHVYFGSVHENTRDAIERGQHWVERGEEKSQAKLTENDVREIRKRYEQTAVTQYQLSDEYDIGQSTLSQIILRKSWKHVD